MDGLGTGNEFAAELDVIDAPTRQQATSLKSDLGAQFWIVNRNGVEAQPLVGPLCERQNVGQSVSNALLGLPVGLPVPHAQAQNDLTWMSVGLGYDCVDECEVGCCLEIFCYTPLGFVFSSDRPHGAAKLFVITGERRCSGLAIFLKIQLDRQLTVFERVFDWEFTAEPGLKGGENVCEFRLV